MRHRALHGSAAAQVNTKQAALTACVAALCSPQRERQPSLGSALCGAPAMLALLLLRTLVKLRSTSLVMCQAANCLLCCRPSCPLLLHKWIQPRPTSLDASQSAKCLLCCRSPCPCLPLSAAHIHEASSHQPGYILISQTSLLLQVSLPMLAPLLLGTGMLFRSIKANASLLFPRIGLVVVLLYVLWFANSVVQNTVVYLRRQGAIDHRICGAVITASELSAMLGAAVIVLSM